MELTIICKDDCGNAPKRETLREFNIAFVKHDSNFVLDHVTDDILVNMAGGKILRGKELLLEMMGQWKERRINKLHLKNIITHGRTGAVDGTLELKDGEIYAFCHVYNFSSAAKQAKIKEINSYVIQSN